MPQPQTDGQKGQHQRGQTSSLDQRQHGDQRREHQSVERAFPRLAVDVGPGVAHHHPPNEAHQQCHRCLDRIEAKRDQRRPASNPDRDRDRTNSDQLSHTRNRKRQHAKGCSLGLTRQVARTPAGLKKGEAGNNQKQDRGE